MDFSIEGQEVSHSPRTNDKPAGKEQFPPYQDFEEKDKQTIEENTNYDNKPVLDPKEPQQQQNQEGCAKFFTIKFYQQFFQVSQEQVVDRIKMSFMPMKREFIESAKENPDFYGPIWIMTTIIFLLSSTGNLSRYFYNWDKSEYIFKLELVRYGVMVVYNIGFTVPGLLFMVMKCSKCTTVSLPEVLLPLNQLTCIYGYSLSCFILILILCIIPFPWLHWLLMIYGLINSTAFVIINLKDYLVDLEKKAFIVYGIIGAANIALFLIFKLVFFDLIYDGSSS